MEVTICYYFSSKEFMTKEINNILKDSTSAVVLSSTTNNIMNLSSIGTHTYRTYIKPREYGNFVWKIWHSNTVDSTWDDGSVTRANLSGGEWRIDSACLADGGVIADGSIIPDSQVKITFNGYNYKNVLPDEKFSSDPIQFNIPKDHYLVFTWTISNQSTGLVIPYNCETNLVPVYDAPGDCSNEENGDLFNTSENTLVLPALISYNKTVIKKIGFLGDSITQGVRTKEDGYEYWVSKIAEGLGTEYGVWNIGSGWARANDAATDGAWLYKAKQNDEMVVCLGVNDIGTLNRNSEELIQDLKAILNKIKECNPSCKIILLTVPTFDFTAEQEINWRKTNDFIRSNSLPTVDRIFDIAAVLSGEAPKDNLEKAEYHSNFDDPHPNGRAGTAIADAFLEWY